MIAGLCLAAIVVAISVTFRIQDPDIWQHLAVGRAIWRMHSVPTTNLWAWPVYGMPDVCPSWLFRVMLWPFFNAGGTVGLYVWRWLVTLAAFVLLWLTARRMGARGFAALFALALAALSWRLRSQVRPETLVGVILALELWILESWRRARDPRPGAASAPRVAVDRRVLLIPLLWIWANAHLSWPFGFAIVAAYGSDALVFAGKGRGRAGLEFLALVLAAFALTFANPSGASAVAQPFDFFLHQRHEALYSNISELGPIMWGVHWRTGLPVLMAGWPLLVIARARRHGIDVAEVSLCALFTWLAISSQRFIGFYALTAAPFLGRDLSNLLPRPVAPRPWWSFAVFAVLTLGFSVLEWSRPNLPIAIGFDFNVYPVGACDYIASRNLRGPFFNEFSNAGYMLWRFWPDRTRLPFMDVHQSGTPEDRRLYPYVFGNADAWRALDGRRHFEVLLVDGSAPGVVGNFLPDRLDADSTWALVFRDDNACLYMRRDGRYSDLARREGYAIVPGASDHLSALGQACARDPRVRAGAYQELLRQLGSSRFNARASSLLANLDLMEGRGDLASDRLRHALDLNPGLFTLHERLGLIAFRAGQVRDALREFDLEARLGAGIGGGELQLHRGQALEALGRPKDAMEAYRRQLAQRPDDSAAKAALQRLQSPR